MNGRTITEADVVAFANLTGDHHPQHTDAQWAARGPFGERIAHGMLVLSYAVGLVDVDPERITALRRVREVVFKRPVAIGDTISVEVRPAGDAGDGLEAYEWRVTNQHGRLVLRAVVDAVVRSERTGAEDELAAVPVTL
jgi:acyl dehydratase